MSLRRKIFIAFVLMIALSGAAATYWVQREARDSYAHIVEEILVDIAQLFAMQIETELPAHHSNLSEATFDWAKTFQTFKERQFAARILNVIKDRSALDAYVTDEKGKVIYSSRSQDEVGRDYSKWLDVALTLQGKYGARATREIQSDRNTSRYYIGAPIRKDNKIVGMVSVIKPRTSITGILDYFFRQMIFGVSIAIALALVFGALLFAWITRPVEKLKHYALEIASGNKASLPAMPHKELQQLSEAFEHMRVSLENRQVIERFIQSLTHELKSPLAAMRGSAELTLEPMEEKQRQRFLQNIIDESRRAEIVLEEILGIAALESQNELKNIEPLNVGPLLDQAQNSLISLCEKSQVRFEKVYKEPIQVQGDPFLLTQAFRNILQNAVEFSEAGGAVTVTVNIVGEQAIVQIADNGAGIPDFAQPKIFEKFYSLERPRTGRKGTGLGLSFVQEVVHLHKGRLHFRSPPLEGNSGTVFEIFLPLRLK